MKRGILLGLVLLVVVAVGFVIWASRPYGEPMPEARAALRSGGGVAVEDDRWLTFRPVGREVDAGFVFYPGARVLAEAYAPMAREIAEQGYLVVLMPMPLNLAILNGGEAEDVIGAFPDVGSWVVGGHSLGGVVAADFAHDNPAAVDGLVLLAAYPRESADLSGRKDLDVASIYGTRDEVISLEKLEESPAVLPEDAEFIAVEGGNHAGFGWYGEQRGDGRATVSRREQQERVMAETVQILE